MAGDTRMVRRGAGHSYILDGEPVDGVTSILSAGVPKPALVGWAANTTAAYAVDRWDELADVGVAERLTRLQQARYESNKAATVRGTTVHGLAEQLIRGDEVDVDDALIGYVDACLDFLTDYDVDEIAVEAVVVNRGNAAGAGRYMGCADLLARVRGEIWLADWKTGLRGIFPEVALQLAAYSHAQTFLVDDFEVPLPPIDRCVAVWLRADGYDVYPVDAGDDTYRTFLYVQQLAAFTQAPRGTYVRDALAHPEKATA
jgi:hypothetical protein